MNIPNYNFEELVLIIDTEINKSEIIPGPLEYYDVLLLVKMSNNPAKYKIKVNGVTYDIDSEGNCEFQPKLSSIVATMLSIDYMLAEGNKDEAQVTYKSLDKYKIYREHIDRDVEFNRNAIHTSKNGNKYYISNATTGIDYPIMDDEHLVNSAKLLIREGKVSLAIIYLKEAIINRKLTV